jgi:septal ring factor EnvC (AmiA/AmiB activator)
MPLSLVFFFVGLGIGALATGWTILATCDRIYHRMKEEKEDLVKELEETKIALEMEKQARVKQVTELESDLAELEAKRSRLAQKIVEREREIEHLREELASGRRRRYP